MVLLEQCPIIRSVIDIELMDKFDKSITDTEKKIICLFTICFFYYNILKLQKTIKVSVVGAHVLLPMRFRINDFENKHTRVGR